MARVARGGPFWLCALLAVSGCDGSGTKPGMDEGTTARKVKVDRPGLPLAALNEHELDRFKQGDALFEATVRTSDGLGPLYIRDACSACHAGDGRGPGLVTKVVPARGGTELPNLLVAYGPTERPYAVAGAKVPLLAPQDGSVRVEHRLPPAVFGRGYLEAIADQDITRLAELAERRTGSVRGRIHRLKDGSIGRFGIKARLATLRDFTADALNSDMGLTSPSRPEEPAGPEGLRDDEKPGIDFSAEQVELISGYLRALRIPERRASSDRGRALFEAAQCSVCHVPSFTTSNSYPLAALAGIQVDVYTDLLLHDMGAGLADGLTEGSAGPREFRTGPLIGLRFLSSLLHDGRAKTVEAAILAHDGEDSEARDSIASFRALPASERAELVKFVEAL